MSTMPSPIFVTLWVSNNSFLVHTLHNKMGLLKKKHRHIATIARTLLVTSVAPQDLWVEAILTSVYLINLLPTPTLNWDTPHTRLYGHSPSYSSLRVFGWSGFPHLGCLPSNKLSNHIVKCVFIGYGPQRKDYHCLDPKTSRVYVSRHVLFNETHFSYKQLQVQSQSDSGEFKFVLSSSPSAPLQASMPSPPITQSGPSPIDLSSSIQLQPPFQRQIHNYPHHRSHLSTTAVTFFSSSTAVTSTEQRRIYSTSI